MSSDVATKIEQSMNLRALLIDILRYNFIRIGVRQTDDKLIFLLLQPYSKYRYNFKFWIEIVLSLKCSISPILWPCLSSHRLVVFMFTIFKYKN